MIRYLALALSAQLRRGRTLFLLTVSGVALGVASVLSIQLINANALAAFSGGVRAVSGDADLTVLGRVPAFPESLLAGALGTPGVAVAWPLVRIDVALEGRDEFYLEVLGFDLFAPVPVPLRPGGGTDPEDGGEGATGPRDGSDARGGGARSEVPDIDDPISALRPALRERGWVAVSPELASELGWARGDTFRVSSGSRTAFLRVGALVDFREVAPLAGSRMVVADIAQAQALLGRRGEIHQVDVIADEGADTDALAARLQQRLGPAVEVVRPEQREKRAEGLVSAFRLNLTALSLISLFVGLFLVYTSTQAALVRRREEFGLLRTLGATRAQVFGLILAEVGVLGALGTAVGLPLGWWAAKANLGVVNATLTNLYLLEAIETLHVPARLYALAAAVGIGGAVLGALAPAADITRRDTRALLAAFTLHERLGSRAWRLAASGAALLLVTAAWFQAFGSGWRPAGFVLGSALLVGLPLFTPALVRGLCGRIRVRGFGWRYALRGLEVRLHTTAFAIAALGVAVSMLLGITLLIGSFRRTVETWIETSVRADIYITTRSWSRAGNAAILDPELAAALSTHPGVLGVDRLRQFPVRTGEREIVLAGVEMELPGAEARFPLLAGDPAEAWRAMREEGAVIIGEPLARKEGLAPGDSLVLATPSGPRAFPIAAVSYDYTTEHGSAAISLERMAEVFGPGPIQNIALYLEAGRNPERVVDELKSRFAEAPLEIRSHRRLREEILAIFDQTFAVTRILQAMSLLIAVVGITLTLLILARERAGELALYRALGATRRQIFGVFVREGTGIGAFGLLLGGVGGIGLAWILVHVINPAYFGWTIRMHTPLETVAGQAATILVAAFAASLYPALRASRASVPELSRDEL